MTDQASPFRKLEQLRPILHNANIGKSAKTVRQNISDTFGVPANEDRLIHSRIKQTRRLIVDVQRELKNLPEIDSDLYLAWIPIALQMFQKASNLDTHWQRPGLTEAELLRIDFCVHALKNNFTEEHIAKEKLQEIRKATEELRADVLKAEFESDLEQALVDAFDVLLIAIDEYSLRGTVRLKEGLSIAVGTVIINFGALTKPEEKSKWENLKDRFASIVSGLWTLIQFAIKNKTELGTTWTVIQKFIGSGSEPPPENK